MQTDKYKPAEGAGKKYHASHVGGEEIATLGPDTSAKTIEWALNPDKKHQDKRTHAMG